MLNAIVLISGSGSNLQALIDKSHNKSINIKAVISNNENAFGLKRAKDANIKTYAINNKLASNEFDLQLIEIINKYSANLIILAGFMRILSAAFVSKFYGKIINIHPSLLPKFTGLDTHKRAIEAGEKEHGATVHFVTADLDMGPIIMQAKVKVKKDDKVKILANRVLKEEHKLYPKVVKLFSENKISLQKEKVKIL